MADLVTYVEPQTLAPYHGEAKRLLGGTEAEASRALIAATRAFTGVYELAQTQSAKHKRTAEIYLPSFVDCVLDLARLGITPGSDEAYLIPYWSGSRRAYEVEVIVGPRGLMRLAYESGSVGRILAETVCDGDSFDYDLDEGTFKLRKGKRLFGSQAARHEAITDVFAQAIIYAQGVTDATYQKRLVVLSRGDIEYYRDFSRAPDGDLWGKHYDGAAKKTAIKRLCEQLPRRDGKFAIAMRETPTGGFLRPSDWESVQLPAQTRAPRFAAPSDLTSASSQGDAEQSQQAETRSAQRAKLEALISAIKGATDATSADDIAKWRTAAQSYPEPHITRLRDAWTANEILGPFEATS